MEQDQIKEANGKVRDKEKFNPNRILISHLISSHHTSLSQLIYSLCVA